MAAVIVLAGVSYSGVGFFFVLFEQRISWCNNSSCIGEFSKVFYLKKAVEYLR